MKNYLKQIEDKVRNDYKGILSDEQIKVTIKYWQDFVSGIIDETMDEHRHPMGVSQWKEFGRRYGYWKYFKNKK